MRSYDITEILLSQTRSLRSQKGYLLYRRHENSVVSTKHLFERASKVGVIDSSSTKTNLLLGTQVNIAIIRTADSLLVHVTKSRILRCIVGKQTFSDFF